MVKVVTKYLPVLVLTCNAFFWFHSAVALANSYTERSVESDLNLPPYEIQALHDLYISTAGEYWAWLPNTTLSGIHWNFSEPDPNPCMDKWQGLTCTSSPYFLATLELQYFNLSGYLPSSVGVFAYLTQFTLGHNSLRGTIPQAVGNLSSLVNLDVNHNRLTGCIPESIGNLTNLRYLRLYSNRLECTIPSTIGKLSELSIINLNTNFLTGTIPPSVGDIPGIVDLYLQHNNLHGQIPASVGNWTSLLNFEVFFNGLSGTIPTSVGNMRSMQYFLVDNNFLTGSLPDSIALLSELIQLGVNNNTLTGTLPPSYGKLAKLSLLQTCINFLNGSIPDTYGNMVALTKIQMCGSLLSGSIPSTLGRLPLLNTLNVEANLITGSLPPSLANCSLMNYIATYVNRMNGTLPPEYGALSLLTYFDVSNNNFTGTIPAEYANNSINAVLNVNTNLLVGTLPAVLGKLRLMNYLDFSSNQLTGSIPDAYGAMTKVEYFYGQYNSLTGTLPASLGTMTSILELKVNNNRLSGTIPRSLQILRNATNIFLNNNYFTGSLHNVTNAAVQTQLNAVLVNNNLLTGPLPDEVFHLPSLLTFAAGSNCLTGTVPSSACGSASLSTLSLDGMSVATSCRSKQLFSLSTEDAITHSTVPLCLLRLPNISTLHLSATGLTGSLPNSLLMTPTLQDLSLSHNTLTGTIPEILQSKQWVNLDLSFNKLTGELSPAFAEQIATNTTVTTLALANNRLSGVIPHAVAMVQNIKLLTSNVFSCRIDKTDLPPQDSDGSNYQCGSDSFDAPFYVWLGAAVTMLIVCLTAPGVTNVADIVQLMRTPESSTAAADMPQLAHATSVAVLLLKLSLASVSFGLLVLVPVYAILSAFYGTYKHQYAYVVSAAFLSGTVPFALLFALWLFLLCGMLRFFQYLLGHLRHPPASASDLFDNREASSSTIGSHVGTRHPLERLAVYTAFILVNFTSVVGVNIAYVYVALYQSTSALVAMQVFLSFFKLFWNKFCSGYLVHWIANYISNFDLEAVKQYSKEFMSIQLVIALVNMILVPCGVVAVINPDCFYNAFVPPPAVVTEYTYTDCTEFLGPNHCAAYATESGSSSYNPYFQYSYQCSSSFVTYYAPAFVFLCITGSFVVPAATMLCAYLNRRSAHGTNAHNLLERMLPRVMRPVPADTTERDLFKPICTSKSEVITLLTYLGIMLSFGVMFPPLAMALAVSMLITVVLANIRIQSYIRLAVQQKSLHSVQIIEAECRNVASDDMLRSSFWILLTCSCWFYTLFLFDTLGDVVGVQGAYWVLIVMPLMPPCMYCVYRIIGADNSSASGARAPSSPGARVEMADMNVPVVNVLH